MKVRVPEEPPPYTTADEGGWVLAEPGEMEATEAMEDIEDAAEAVEAVVLIEAGSVLESPLSDSLKCLREGVGGELICGLIDGCVRDGP